MRVISSVGLTGCRRRVVPTDQLLLRAALSAFLGRYRGQPRVHTDSDLELLVFTARLSFEGRGGHPRPVEWTDGLTVGVARGTSLRDLVLYLRAVDEQGTRRRDVLTVLTERFALAFDDARLAMDRVGGGVVRAASGKPANAPDPIKDPLAWILYRLELGLPSTMTP